MKKIVPLIFVLLGAALLVGLIWVGYHQRSEEDSLAEHSVGATIAPLGDIAKNIVEETGVEVVTLLPPGASPHTYEPTPGNVRAANETAVLFSVGAGLDEWAEDLGEAANVPVVEVITFFPEEGLEEGEEHEDEVEEGEEDDDGHGGINPHVWLSIPNAIAIVEEMTVQLQAAFPEFANTFETNAAAYITELEAADAEVREILEDVENPNIITFHDSYPYFADEYGLTVVGSFEPSAGQEPTPQYLRDLQNAARDANVTVVYSEPQLSTTMLEPFVRDLGLTIAELDPIGGFEGRETYMDLMRYNATTIAEHQ